MVCLHGTFTQAFNGLSCATTATPHPGHRGPRKNSVSADRATGDRYRVTLQWNSRSQHSTRKSNGLRKGTTGRVAKKLLRADTCTHLD